MLKLARKLLCLTLCICLAACSTLRAVPDWNAGIQAPVPRVNIGDTLVLTLKSGGRQQMIVAAVEPAAITGRVSNPDQPQPVRVTFDQIAQIERSEVDALKTTLLVVLLIVGASAAALSKAAFFPPPP